jgi:hypothetical protein
MKYNSWYYGGIEYKDYRHSDHPEDWEPARHRRKAKRIKGKRVCSKAKDQLCDFTSTSRLWSFTRSDKTKTTITWYANSCSRCGRHGKGFYKEFTVDGVLDKRIDLW